MSTNKVTDDKGWTPTIEQLDGVYFAVFNTREHLEKKALRMTTTVYGKKEVEKHLKPLIKSGVMGIFQKPPNEVSLFYAFTLAKITDNYHKRYYPKGST